MDASRNLWTKEGEAFSRSPVPSYSLSFIQNIPRENHNHQLKEVNRIEGDRKDQNFLEDFLPGSAGVTRTGSTGPPTGSAGATRAGSTGPLTGSVGATRTGSTGPPTNGFVGALRAGSAEAKRDESTGAGSTGAMSTDHY